MARGTDFGEPRLGRMLDLIIVGGGAAGIAAGLEARTRGLSAVILEASDRIGGRAHSIQWNGHALDLGAGWLHSADRNPMVGLAEQKELAIDRSPSPWRKQYRNLGFSPEEQAAANKATEAFEERVLNNPPASDRASDALDANGEWNGFLNSLSNYLNGTGLNHVSAADWVAYWEEAGEQNWRLPGGYGTLISALADGLDVRTGFAVVRVERLAGRVRVICDDGELEAKRAIVAVPTDVLASGRIRFDPAVDDQLHAATQLPLGHVEKLFFELAEPEEFPNDAHLIGNPRSADCGSYMLRPLGMPVVEAFLGGDWVKGRSIEELADKARQELGALLGADFPGRLRLVAASDWQRHPFIGGSYSYARPGQHGARAILRAQVDERLVFAGEACSDSDYATVHAAWESGKAAVSQLSGS
jgi:monoamine oxidase